MQVAECSLDQLSTRPRPAHTLCPHAPPPFMQLLIEQRTHRAVSPVGWAHISQHSCPAGNGCPPEFATLPRDRRCWVLMGGRAAGCPAPASTVICSASSTCTLDLGRAAARACRFAPSWISRTILESSGRTCLHHSAPMLSCLSCRCWGAAHRCCVS